MGYWRTASRGPCQVDMKLQRGVSSAVNYSERDHLLDVVAKDFTDAVHAGGAAKLGPERCINMPMSAVNYQSQ